MRAPQEIAVDNLTLWREAAGENRELRLLQAEQMGKTAANDPLWETAALPALWTQEPDAIKEKNGEESFWRTLTTDEQVAFCKGFLAVRALLPPKESLPAPPAAARVAFFDSFFAREALRRFEKVLPLPRSVTAPSFTAVCEELANGNADFALLPLSDSREGSFRRLLEEIDRFELRITHICDIPYPDEGRTVSMALLTRLYSAPQTKGRHERLLSCALFEESKHTLSNILQAALFSGLSVKTLDTLPAPYGEDGVFFHPVFRAPGEAEQQLFEAYLTLFAPRARIIERYVYLG